MASTASLTELIQRMQNGDREAAASVFAQAAGRLRAMSRAMVARDTPTAGFGASDLVQETFFKKVMGLDRRMRIHDSSHFFSVVANGMRQILTDRARARRASKRQMPSVQEWLSIHGPIRMRGDLVRAMQKLERLDPAAHRIVQLKNDYGLTWDEVAVEMGIPLKAARAEFDYAIHWLRREIA